DVGTGRRDRDRHAGRGGPGGARRSHRGRGRRRGHSIEHRRRRLRVTAAAERLVVRARPWSDGAPVRGADAIAIAGGRIVAIGSARELEALADDGTERIDAAGATVTPGIT